MPEFVRKPVLDFRKDVVNRIFGNIHCFGNLLFACSRPGQEEAGKCGISCGRGLPRMPAQRVTVLTLIIDNSSNIL